MAEEYYIVQSGDNLSKIANKLGVNLSTLLKENNINNPDLIRPGEKLKYNTLVSGRNNKLYLELIIKTLPPQPTKYWWKNILPKFTTNTNSHDWVEVINKEKQLNNKFGTNYKALINQYHRDKHDNQYYVIDDKENNRTGIYINGKLVKEFTTIHGANGQQKNWDAHKKATFVNANYDQRDNYTITITRPSDKKIIDGIGNMSTPAGLFYMNPSDNYHNAPAWTRSSKRNGTEKDLVPSSMHYRNVYPGAMSNGCTGISGNDLREMKRILGNTKDVPCYVLPYDKENNKFFVRNGVLNYSSYSSLKKYGNKWLNAEGKVAKYYREEDGTLAPVPSGGQLNGVYKGLKTKLNFVLKNTFDNDQTRIANEFAKALSTNKNNLMEDLGINDDTYNNLALAALGICGRESSYGVHHNEIENLAKAVTKKIGLWDTSPDIYRKFEGYSLLGYKEAADSPENSIGLTQMRLKWRTDNEKRLFKKYKITPRDLVYSPKKAAIATMIHLAQLYVDENLNLDRAINKWNTTQKDYVESVKNRIKKDWTLYVSDIK